MKSVGHHQSSRQLLITSRRVTRDSPNHHLLVNVQSPENTDDSSDLSELLRTINHDCAAQRYSLVKLLDLRSTTSEFFRQDTSMSKRQRLFKRFREQSETYAKNLSQEKTCLTHKYRPANRPRQCGDDEADDRSTYSGFSLSQRKSTSFGTPSIVMKPGRTARPAAPLWMGAGKTITSQLCTPARQELCPDTSMSQLYSPSCSTRPQRSKSQLSAERRLQLPVLRRQIGPRQCWFEPPVIRNCTPSQTTPAALWNPAANQKILRRVLAVTTQPTPSIRTTLEVDPSCVTRRGLLLQPPPLFVHQNTSSAQIRGKSSAKVASVSQEKIVTHSVTQSEESCCVNTRSTGSLESDRRIASNTPLAKITPRFFSRALRSSAFLEKAGQLSLRSPRILDTYGVVHRTSGPGKSPLISELEKPESAVCETQSANRHLERAQLTLRRPGRLPTTSPWTCSSIGHAPVPTPRRGVSNQATPVMFTPGTVNQTAVQMQNVRRSRISQLTTRNSRKDKEKTVQLGAECNKHEGNVPSNRPENLVKQKDLKVDDMISKELINNLLKFYFSHKNQLQNKLGTVPQPQSESAKDLISLSQPIDSYQDPQDDIQVCTSPILRQIEVSLQKEKINLAEIFESQSTSKSNQFIIFGKAAPVSEDIAWPATSADHESSANLLFDVSMSLNSASSCN